MYLPLIPNLKVGENEMVESVSAFDFSLFVHSWFGQ